MKISAFVLTSLLIVCSSTAFAGGYGKHYSPTYQNHYPAHSYSHKKPVYKKRTYHKKIYRKKVYKKKYVRTYKRPAYRVIRRHYKHY